MRQKAANFQGYAECYTCRKQFIWQELQMGHFWHGKLDFDLRNLKPQCSRCNWRLHGNLGRYAARLIQEHGQPWYDTLERDAAHVDSNRYSTEQLNILIQKYGPHGK